MFTPAFNRRNFLRFAAIASAGAALPIVNESHLAMAQLSTQTLSAHHPAPSADAVLINANENPLGPCASARATIASLIPDGGRYQDDLTETLTKTIATKEGLKPEYVAVYAGSSEPLHYSVLAFTSKTRGYVTADPGYEAGAYAAKASGANIAKVPLTKTHAHDIRAMLAADPNAGLLYICNPNNPTGTITPREEIDYALANKPSGSILLVDEAYIHFADQPSMIDMVRDDKEIIVLRTFSKIYGMAGVRCGFAAGRPDLLAKLKPFGWNAMPIFAVAAATTSLNDAAVVPERKKYTAGVREETLSWLTSKGYAVTDSHSNCFMVDTRRPARDVITAMAKQNVYIGRPWPAWNNWVRVTVGTSHDMAQFRTAFQNVMNA
jgi:histidinol-phosphate aminotransferase